MKTMYAEIKPMLERRAARLCPFCSKDITKEKFRDRLSAKEAELSGLCQKCQDEFYGKEVN